MWITDLWQQYSRAMWYSSITQKQYLNVLVTSSLQIGSYSENQHQTISSLNVSFLCSERINEFILAHLYLNN